jgi:hypothetical protein
MCVSGGEGLCGGVGVCECVFACVCVCVGQKIQYKNTNVPLILKVCGVIFLSRAKHIMGHFLGFFEGTSTFLTHKITLCNAQDN